MNLLIDNNDGLGPQDYTSYLNAGHLPKIGRKLNAPASMVVALVAGDATLRPPLLGARVTLQRSDGYSLFTGYLAMAPEMEYLGKGQLPAWRYILNAIDDSWLLDRNEMPERTAFVSRTAGDALSTLANDVLPGVLDESGVQDSTPINQFVMVPQEKWTWHAQQLGLMARSSYRAHDGKLDFQPVGQQSFTLSEQQPDFDPTGLSLLQSDKLYNDVTIIGELEPMNYVRDYFLGDGTHVEFYLSELPFGRTAYTVPEYTHTESPAAPTMWDVWDPTGRFFIIFADDYSEAQLSPTLWDVSDPNGEVALRAGQLQLNGGPATITFVEQVELAEGLLMQHGNVVFNAASKGVIGGLYNGTPSNANCIAGFSITPNGSNSNIQALVNGSVSGPVLTTTPGHQYGFATEVICPERQRVHETYLSSLHPAGEARGGDSISANLRVVLSVHDVDPNNPATLAAVATVLYDGVLTEAPGFATYAVVNTTSLFAGVSYTCLQRVVNAEVRSMIPGGQFCTRLGGAFADGGECYITSSGRLCFYAPYTPQLNEEIVVSYRSRARAVARVQDPVSIAEHAQGSDKGQRVCVRHIKLPLALSDVDCENAAGAFLDDAVQQAWQGAYKTFSDFLPVEDVVPGNAVQVSAPSRGAEFSAIVREVEVQVISPATDRSQYEIKFANDADDPLALNFNTVTLPGSITTIYETSTPSSSLYIDSLIGAQVTNVIATEISVDAGVAPPAGGGIEVRRSDGGWGPSGSDNLAGRFTTQAFTLPRLERVQNYYLRQYDGSTPPRYSRYSMLLHVDYPLTSPTTPMIPSA
jgi:hypothetical protein